MKTLPVNNLSEFFKPLSALTSSDFDTVGERLMLFCGVQNELADGLALPSAYVVTDALRANLLEEKTRKEKIKVLVRKLNGAERKEKKQILHSLERIVLNSQLSKSIEKEITTLSKKLIDKKASKTVVKISSFFFVEHFSFEQKQESYIILKKEQDLLVALKQAITQIFLPEVLLESENLGCEFGDMKISFLLERVSEVEVSGNLTSFEQKTLFPGVIQIFSHLGTSGKNKKPQEEDSFTIWKEGLKQKKEAIIERVLGQKTFFYEISNHGIPERRSTPVKLREQISLSEKEIKALSTLALSWEEKNGPCEMTFEKKLGIIYVSGIKKVHLASEHPHTENYFLQKTGKILVKGIGRGDKIASGKIRVIEKNQDVHAFQKGDILVVKEEVLGIVDIIPHAGALIISDQKTNSSLVCDAREILVPVVFVSNNALKNLKNGKRVTVASGMIYEGALPFEVKKEKISALPKTKTRIMVNIENPINAYALARKHNDGVGMIRFESLFVHSLKIHPLAFVLYPKIKDKKSKRDIEFLTRGYKEKKYFAVEKLAEGLAQVASAFYPAPVTVRLSDFKSNEFSTLIGASEFKKADPIHLFNRDVKENVTLHYREAFALECQAVSKARTQWGLTNIIVMAPLCPTPEQGEEVIRILAENGLKSGENGLRIHGRCEIPANFILAKEFAKIFDGFSLDTHGLEASLENKAAIESLVKDVIHVAHKNNKAVSYQSQAFHDSPAFAEFLVQQGIDSISFSPDEIRDMKIHTAGLERTVGRTGNKTHKGFLTLVVGFGALAASLIGMGSGCSDLMNKDIVPVPEVSEYIPPAKIREELEKNFKKQMDKFTDEKMVTYSEAGFANFRLEYPADWSMEHTGESLTVTGASSTEYMRIFVRSTSLLNSASTSTVHVADREARKGIQVPLSDRVAPELIEIPIKGEKLLTIEGGGERFEKVLSSILISE